MPDSVPNSVPNSVPDFVKVVGDINVTVMVKPDYAPSYDIPPTMGRFSTPESAY